jgi:hypothetical protein
MADSRDMAATFGKKHRNVLADIRNLKCSNDFGLLNFNDFGLLNFKEINLPTMPAGHTHGGRYGGVGEVHWPYGRVCGFGGAGQRGRAAAKTHRTLPSLKQRSRGQNARLGLLAPLTFLAPLQPLNWGMNVQARQVVDEFGVRIVGVIRFNMRQGDEYCGCNDGVLGKI